MTNLVTGASSGQL